MAEQRDYLRHDLTALYAFIECVTGGVVSRRNSAAYSAAAIRFFDFVEALAASSKNHLERWSVDDSEEFEDRRGELGTIRAAWREFHKLIKPALDADTLQAPSAVVDGIVRRFRELELPGCKETEFALFHTSEFNYVQVHTADLRRTAEKIRHIIPEAPLFPDNLGLIGLPYSQGRTAFANCLVAHEMGHHIYRRMAYGAALQVKADAALKSGSSTYEQMEQGQKDVVIKALTQWSEEIFCDLFGAMLLGPCYPYSYIEAYDLSAILDCNGLVSGDRILPFIGFYEKYPSEIFRLQQQSIFLRESPWWDHISKSSARYATLLKVLHNMPIDAHVKENDKLGYLIPVLDSIMPEIRGVIGNTFEGVDCGFVLFSQLNNTIQKYLANGIVPSTLNVRYGNRPEEVTMVSPSPLVLLNSGMEFYLTRVNELMCSIRDEDETMFPRRLHWIRRIEEWIAKAIEDESLEKEVIDVDPGGNGNPAPPQT
jgi:hypothetical protein